MAFGIDITSDCMVCSGSGDHDKVQREYYGIVGLPPRTNEPFIWDNPLALRTSNQGPYLSLTDVWYNFMNSDPRNAHNVQGEWTNYDGTEYKESAGNLIPQAIAQNIEKSLLSKTILTIDKKFTSKGNFFTFQCNIFSQNVKKITLIMTVVV